MDIIFNEKPAGYNGIIQHAPYFTSNILLVGNGFDVELERKTKFTDCLHYIQFFLSFKNYEDFESSYKTKLKFLPINQDLKDLFYILVINKKHRKFDRLRKLFLELVENSWLSTRFSKTNGNFTGEFYNLKTDSQIEYWCDFESVIQYILGEDLDPLSPFATLGLDKIADYNALYNYEKWLRIFESTFCDYLKDLDIYDNYSSGLNDVLNNIRSDYIDSFISRSRGLLQDISFNKNEKDFIINYNYTNSIEKLLDAKGNILYINGSVYDKNIEKNNYTDNSIVIGCSLSGVASNSNSLSRRCNIFDKKTRRIIKNTVPFNFDRIVSASKQHSNFNLIIFGHSCNLADADVISFLLKHEKLKAALIFCYSYEDLVSIYNSLSQMLGRDCLNKMLDYSNIPAGMVSHKIFFGVKKT